MRKLLLCAAVLAASSASAQQVAGPVQTAPASGPSAPATATVASRIEITAAQSPAANGAEVATIVAKEFPAYDKDADGALNQNEFGAWMVRLKTIADPATRPDAPSIRTWLNAAFAQADADRSRSLTLGELTGFLSQGRS